MTIYWAGTESDAFDFGAAPSATEDTNSFFFDATYSRAAVHTGSGSPSQYFASIPWGSNLTELWLHFYLGMSIGWGPDLILVELVNGSGQPVFRLTTNGAQTGLQASYWNGATFSNVGSAGIIAAIPNTYDLYLKCGTSGGFELFINGTSLTSGSISDADCDNVEEIRWYAANGSPSGATHVSEAVVADTATIGWHVFTRPPTGNGANTAWAGAFGDVDEAVKDDADFISGAANGDIETYTGAAATLTGFSVKAVVVGARARRDTGGPQNLQMALRESSTDYASANVPALGAGFGGRQAIFAVDPATGVAWTISDAGSAGLEFGVKAIT